MFCILTRSKLEVWISTEKAKKVFNELKGDAKWLVVEDCIIATSDIVGIIGEDTMYEKKQRERGFVQLKGGHWFSKRDGNENWREPYIPVEEENNKLLEDKK